MSKKKKSAILKCEASILDLEVKLEELDEEKVRVTEHIQKQKERLEVLKGE